MQSTTPRQVNLPAVQYNTAASQSPQTTVQYNYLASQLIIWGVYIITLASQSRQGESIVITRISLGYTKNFEGFDLQYEKVIEFFKKSAIKRFFTTIFFFNQLHLGVWQPVCQQCFVESAKTYLTGQRNQMTKFSKKIAIAPSVPYTVGPGL